MTACIRRLASAAAIFLALTAVGSVARAAPVVVFESGLGDGGAPWKAVREALPTQVLSYAYDRPGYGHAPPTRAPRDACTIARELHTRLQAEHVPPPYLLVGHSLGGRYVYAFGRLFPSDTAGLVLVDATPPGHLAAIKERTPEVARTMQLARTVLFRGPMRAEYDAQDDCLAALPSGPLPFGARVLVKTRPDPGGGAALFNLQQELNPRWLTLTGAARLEKVEGSSHYIQKDRPDAVAAAILDLWRP